MVIIKVFVLFPRTLKFIFITLLALPGLIHFGKPLVEHGIDYAFENYLSEYIENEMDNDRDYDDSNRGYAYDDYDTEYDY